MEKTKALMAKSTILQCENCHLYLNKSVIDAPKNCPGCNEDALFSIVKISAADLKYVTNNISLYESHFHATDIG